MKSINVWKNQLKQIYVCMYSDIASQRHVEHFLSFSYFHSFVVVVDYIRFKLVTENQQGWDVGWGGSSVQKPLVSRSWGLPYIC